VKSTPSIFRRFSASFSAVSIGGARAPLLFDCNAGIGRLTDYARALRKICGKPREFTRSATYDAQVSADDRGLNCD
jgi:hypothetical protein